MRGKTKKVLEHLQTNGSITTIGAFMLFKATRLSAIIYNLRKYGYSIISKPESYTNADGETSHFVRYIYEGEVIDNGKNGNI